MLIIGLHAPVGGRRPDAPRNPRKPTATRNPVGATAFARPSKVGILRESNGDIQTRRRALRARENLNNP